MATTPSHQMDFLLCLPSSLFRPAEGCFVCQLGPCLPGSAIRRVARWRCRSRRAATPWLPGLLCEKNRNLKSSRKYVSWKIITKYVSSSYGPGGGGLKRPSIFLKIWILKYLFKFLLFLLSVRSTKKGCRNTKMRQLESRVMKLLSKLQWMEMNEEGEQNRKFFIFL